MGCPQASDSASAAILNNLAELLVCRLEMDAVMKRYLSCNILLITSFL